MAFCREYDRLQTAVQSILQKLVVLTKQQLEVFQAGDDVAFTQLDRELELTVGEKERAIGAARQHAKDHNCQPK